MKGSIKGYLKLIGSSKIYLIVLGSAYLIGIAVGCVFSPMAQRFVLSESVAVFYYNAFSSGGRIFSLIFTVVLSDVFFLVIFYGCSFTFFTVFIDLALLFYRGYVLSCVAFLFIKMFGVSGAFLYVLCVFLHNAVFSAALCVFAAITAKLSRRKNKNFYDLRNDLFILTAAAGVVAVAAELIFLLCVLRPINSIF